MTNGSGKSSGHKRAASDGRRSTRGKSTARSESPVKKTPARKMATPRKPRKTGRGKSTEPDLDAVNGDRAKQETVKVEVETEKVPSPEGDEVEHTKVNVEMPADHPDLPLPKSPEEAINEARRMVAEANAASASRTSPKAKRKAAVLDGEDGEPSNVLPTAKRAKTVELELRKEKIKRRALMGIATSVAIGYVDDQPSILLMCFADHI
jgi:hypothetical protein